MIYGRPVSGLAAACIIAVLLGAYPASAQSWPTRPLTMVVPFAAGSASDTVARILGARLSEVLGQQVIIENVAGAGSGSHLACAQLNAAIGVDITHVPYRGSPPAMQDLIAGRIDYFCALAAAAMPQLGSNSMKAIAVMTRNRSPLLPNLASAHEQ